MRRRDRRSTSSWIRRFLIWPAEAGALWLWWAVVRVLPRRTALALGAALGETIGRFSVIRSTRMEQNLAIAFPDLASAARRRMVRRIWGNFSRVLADYPHLRSIWRHPDKVIEVIGEQHLEAARRSGAFLLVGAHFGHWELPAVYASRTGIKGTAVYSPDPNPLVDALVRRCRLRAGKDGALVAKQSAAIRQVITALGRREAVFLLADHRVDDGTLIPFFGRPAMTTLTPARLARRFGCPILLARAEQLPRGRYRIIYCPPIRPNMALPPQQDVFELTTQLLQSFETWIRTTPEQWNYLKRRWPKHDGTAGRREIKSKLGLGYSRRRQGRAAAA